MNDVVRCVGCRGLVPAEDGPVHRYMTASPGCWRIYTELGATGMPPARWAALTVDAYAVTHPGKAGPQSTPSVWIHLVTLCLILERGWRVDQAVRLRRVSADAFEVWPWLERPDEMGAVTVVDIAGAVDAGDGAMSSRLVDEWVDGAWTAWSAHHERVRERAGELAERSF